MLIFFLIKLPTQKSLPKVSITFAIKYIFEILLNIGRNYSLIEIPFVVEVWPLLTHIKFFKITIDSNERDRRLMEEAENTMAKSHSTKQQ